MHQTAQAFLVDDEKIINRYDYDDRWFEYKMTIK